jgi:hypothetical protein
MTWCRVHLLVVDGYLREGAGGERADGADAVLLVVPDDRADGAHHVVRVIDVAARDETVREPLQGQLGGLAGAADHALLDAEPVHLAQRDAHRVVGRQVVRDVLEHVLRREGERLRLLVLELLTDEVVLRGAGLREGDHRVDDRDSGGEGHLTSS